MTDPNTPDTPLAQGEPDDADPDGVHLDLVCALNIGKERGQHMDEAAAHHFEAAMRRIIREEVQRALYARTGDAPRCDCGAPLTSCYDCAVADYQSSNLDCPRCVVQPAEDAPATPTWSERLDAVDPEGAPVAGAKRERLACAIIGCREDRWSEYAKMHRQEAEIALEGAERIAALLAPGESAPGERERELEAALETLVETYVMNRGSVHEFVATRTVEGVTTEWRAALDLLARTPATATEGGEDE